MMVGDWLDALYWRFTENKGSYRCETDILETRVLMFVSVLNSKILSWSTKGNPKYWWYFIFWSKFFRFCILIFSYLDRLEKVEMSCSSGGAWTCIYQNKRECWTADWLEAGHVTAVVWNSTTGPGRFQTSDLDLQRVNQREKNNSHPEASKSNSCLKHEHNFIFLELFCW